MHRLTGLHRRRELQRPHRRLPRPDHPGQPQLRRVALHQRKSASLPIHIHDTHCARIQALGPMLKSAGFPAQFVVDQGRAGQQNLRQQWGDWCNIKGAGFGTRPTTSTGNPLIDAIIWVKPGGESDGTSNSSSPRYDSTCSLVRSAPLCEGGHVCLLLWCSPTRRSPHPRLVPGSRRTSKPLCRRPTRRCEGKRDGVRSCSRSVLYLVQNLGVSLSFCSLS